MEKQQKKSDWRFWPRLAYDFVKVTAAIPALIWLRPKWLRVDRESRHITGAELIVGNHNTFYDPIAMMVAMYHRRLRFVATEELFAGKFKNWLFTRVFRCIPINQQNMRMQTLRDVNEALKAGSAVALFPEGHVLTEEESRSGAMRSGMVLMAAQGKCPIVPVYIMTPEKWYNRLRIAIGAPISVQTKGPMPTLGEIERFTGEVAQSMRELRDICLNDANKKTKQE